MHTVASFSITFERYIDKDGKQLAELPEFAR